MEDEISAGRDHHSAIGMVERPSCVLAWVHALVAHDDREAPGTWAAARP
jgi:hypothetical protein